MSFVEFVQSRIDTAKQGFSTYEADWPEMSREWWETRSHRGPADFLPAEFDAFLGALGQCTPPNDTSANLHALCHAIDNLRSARHNVRAARDTRLKTKLRGVGVALHLTYGHTNFFKALDVLKSKVRERPNFALADYDY